MKKTKHLYIHIPFCNHICHFCDFKRIATNSDEIMTKYVNKVISELKKQSVLKQYQTIYLGGGTPNHLNNGLLRKLLRNLQLYLKPKFEFTIECNPELVNESQVKIFKKYGINRISLGVQSTNNLVLKKMNRMHTVEDAQEAINLFKKNQITNISLDFIYNLPSSSINDIDDAIKFIKKNKIKHLSYYALEIKENAFLNKKKYQLNLDEEEKQMLYLQKQLTKTHLKRYEISNWATAKKYQSKHNLAYWKWDDWKAIGYGAYGLEKNQYYWFGGKINHWKKTIQNQDLKTYQQQKIIMGLRLIDGLNLNLKTNYLAYQKFKDFLSDTFIDKKNHLKVKKIDLLNDVLIKII